MQADLFAPDHHARDNPGHHPARPEDERLISRLIREHYAPGALPTQGPVSAIEAANINSANFRVGGFFFKLMRGDADAESLFLLPRIADRLRAAGIPAGDFVPTAGRESIGHAQCDGETFWFYVQRFLTGGYYSGEPREFSRCLDLLQQLAAEPLAGLDAGPRQREPYASWRPVEDAGEIQVALTKKLTDGPEEFDVRAQAALDALAPGLQELNDLVTGMNADALRHFDLHPHNLLFANNDLLALLDLESFRFVSAETATGYALFKLGRKAIAAGKMSLEQFRITTSAAFDLPTLLPFTLAEIKRRCYSILKQHYRLGRRGWNPNLESHLRGLREAELMFG